MNLTAESLTLTAELPNLTTKSPNLTIELPNLTIELSNLAVELPNLTADLMNFLFLMNIAALEFLSLQLKFFFHVFVERLYQSNRYNRFGQIRVYLSFPYFRD